jgi:hypothetical protein
MNTQRPGPQPDLVAQLRRWVLVVFVLGALGTIVELILLEHYEEPPQLIPDILLVGSLAALGWHLRVDSATTRRCFLALMALFVVSGFVGFVAHFSGSAEFQLELNPDMDTWTLLTKILHAKAPPLLAPGMMIQLGLLGLAYLYSDSRYRKNQGT